MANRFCSPAALLVPSASGDSGSTARAHPSVSRSPVNGPRYPATAASRDRLVFSQLRWDSHLYRFNAGLPAEQVAASSSFETDPNLSPDGRRLAFGSGSLRARRHLGGGSGRV